MVFEEYDLLSGYPSFLRLFLLVIVRRFEKKVLDEAVWGDQKRKFLQGIKKGIKTVSTFPLEIRSNFASRESTLILIVFG